MCAYITSTLLIHYSSLYCKSPYTSSKTCKYAEFYSEFLKITNFPICPEHLHITIIKKNKHHIHCHLFNTEKHNYFALDYISVL